jgi:hypothetical protein
MNIAYITSTQRGEADRALAQFAARLTARGTRVAGVVQINTERQGDGPCDMDVRVLPDGPVIRISQYLGRGAKGCRLNAAALEQAVAEVGAGLSDETGILILNKFGKHEAEGRGFRELIGDALMRDIPVVTGVNALNLEAFLEFTGGLATPLPLCQDALTGWFDALGRPVRRVA